jgi:predicted phage tail protein
VSVGRPLANFEQTVEVSYDSGDDQLAVARFIVDFPGGLFTVDSDGDTQSFAVEFRMRWRYQGDTSWQNFTNGTFTVLSLSRNAFARTKEVSFPLGVDGEIEVQVERLTGAGPQGTASQARLRDVVFQSPYELTYPRVAQLGLVLQASARFNGGLPTIQCRLDGIKVRVWDATNGFSAPTWNVPPTPFNWHTHPPGRNPAWILLDFLTQPWGLGEYLSDDDIDLPAFARWAVWCDRDPDPSDPWGEAQFTCDLVIDKPRPAWEWVLTICAAGGASPVFVNGKVSVVYQYSAAHSQGSVSVPAKTPTQLFTSGNIQDFNVQWLPRANRPTAFVYQFLNEDQNYRQDVLTVEDEESTINDPTELHKDLWRPEQQQAYGVTRSSQLYRDARRRHRINRLVTRRIDFKTGRWALAATIGDLIEVETEVLRPFDADVPTSAVVLVGGTSVSTITVDHQSLPATGQLKYRDADGAPGVVNWTAISTTTVDLTPATELTLASSISVDAGATCVFGSVDKLVQVYEITAISLNEDLSRNVTALQWVPAVHDDIPKADFSDGTDLRGAITAASSTEPEQLPPDYSVGVERLPDGQQRISWQSPALMVGVPKRVYARDDNNQPWQLLGTTENEYFDTTELRANKTVYVSVVPESFSGESRLPDACTLATLQPTEFARHLTPQVNGVQQGYRKQLEWSPITTRLAEEYEVREGQYWVGARTLYRGTEPKVRWDVPPLTDNVTICVQDEDGSQGQVQTQSLTPWSPDGHATFIDTDIVQDGLGTFDNCQRVGSTSIELTSGSLTGTYTSEEQLPGFRASFLWRVSIEAQQLDLATVDDVRDRLGSGELNWRTVDAREASRHNAGVDFTRDVDDATDKVDAYGDELAQGFIGSAGQHTRALLEGRFYDGTSWSAWQQWTDGYRNAERAQFRVVLDRENLNYDLLLHQLRITAVL